MATTSSMATPPATGLSGALGTSLAVGTGTTASASNTGVNSTSASTGTITSYTMAVLGTTHVPPSSVRNTVINSAAGTSATIPSLPGITPTVTSTVSTVMTSPTPVPSSSNAPNAEFRITEEETLFLRLTSLLLKIAPRAVRKLFDIHIPPGNLTQALNKDKANLQRLKQKKVVNKSQWEQLFPAQGTVSSIDFDLTLLILLIRNITGIKEPSTGWNELPATTDLSDGAQIARIKHYRNTIAHNSSGSINKADFTKSWQDVSQAVIAIGGQLYQSEVSALQIAALDQSYRDLYRELKNLAPPSNNEYQQMKLNEWEEEDKPFVPTRSTKALETAIDQNNVTLITGPPGSGKTANAHHIALHYKQKGYQIFNEHSVEKIFDLWKPDGKQLFVLDDIFGVDRVDESEIRRWKTGKDDLTSMFEYSCLKILVTARSYIQQDELLEFLQCQTIDLSSPDIRLTNEERIVMFTKHSSYQDREDLVTLSNDVGNFTIFSFPLLCRRFTADKTSRYSIDNFFSTPLLSLIGQELDDFRINEKVRYFCLLFCMMNDNCLGIGIVSIGNVDKNTKSSRKRLLDICKLPASLSVTEIKSKLDTLLGTYLKIEDGNYQFIHDIIHDAVVQHVNNLHSGVKKLMLSHASPNFIKNRTHLGSLKSSALESTIVITEDLEDAWGDCMLNCIQEGYWNEVFENTCLRTEHADEILTRALNNRADSSVKHLISKCRGKLDKRVLSGRLLSKYTQSLEKKLSDGKCSILHLAVLLGLEKFTKALLTFVNFYQKYVINSYLNLLLLACLSGNEEMVSLFKKYGLNKCSSGKLTPLYLSSGMGYDVIVKRLIEYGCYVNTRVTKWKQTPLHIASQFGHQHMLMKKSGDEAELGNDVIVKLLLDAGADINRYDSDGDSAFHIATRSGNTVIVKLFINARADINKCNSNGESALHIASRYGNTDVVKLLLEAGVDVNKCNIEGRSALHIASRDGNTDIVKLLIEAGVDVNKCDIDGDSALYLASLLGKTDVVKLLLEAGVDVNKCKIDGESALCIASRNGNTDIVKLLIEAGVDVNKWKNNGESVFYFASLLGDIGVLKLLVEAGVDVNKCDVDGKSALYIASMFGKTDIVKLLLEAGVDVNKCNIDGEPALYIASEYGNTDIVKLLLEAGVDVNKCNNIVDRSALHIASEYGNTDIVKLLIETGVDVNKCDIFGASALHIASEYGNTDIVKLLIEAEVDVNKCNIDGRSALRIASEYGNTDIVKLLIEAGVDVNKCDSFGRSALYIASQCGNTDIVKLLLEAGLDVNKCKVEGEPALRIASLVGNTDIVKLLLEAGVDVNKCDIK